MQWQVKTVNYLISTKICRYNNLPLNSNPHLDKTNLFYFLSIYSIKSIPSPPPRTPGVQAHLVTHNTPPPPSHTKAMQCLKIKRKVKAHDAKEESLTG